ncbi:glucose 1,6-bisphosphate synthase isoform X1 [Alosa alosa]|uniref:glucose 1,6-bisphosphate synthase isoform X1 n=1 Tax=Alosa alosa TaxID=278164 RepID=UPI0020153E76|nr:glucose 1,6-bisphosphate synthase isoform X1 [Alosa alosa]XP_048120898.1 glucose 1,6-bisphosphate synthase isoform X1 [Alosa alosa]XP_048120899.1 glucose 1,6-bisphosphate synthase isoform X1 [Alosa alosa]
MNANQNCHATGDPQLDKAIYQWITWDRNVLTRAQIEELSREKNVDELRRRLCYRMAFGTAGLRAAMGAGFSCINDLTVIQSTQGMYKYLSKFFPDLRSRGVVVGYDTRAQDASGCTSERLARLTAAVMLCKDIPVHLFSTYVPTPFVPYAVKKLGAAAGVMVTASHNPKEDNGYKVYWHNGAQISSPHDKEILRCIEDSTEPWPESWNEGLADSSPLRSDPLDKITRLYMDELATVCFHRELNSQSPLKFVHSSFHGVGHNYVQRAFQACGFPPPIPVPEQKDPDPSFSTVSCPNPEEGASVLELSLRLAEREGAKIVLATDPDADRLAVAELRDTYVTQSTVTSQRDVCGWKAFTGNELAALLGWWMLYNWKETHSEPSDTDKVYMLATTVSSKILKAFAQMEGFHFEETLPGFKWIGNKIHELEKTGNEVIFSFEESIGFLCGTMVPDKDGVSAAVVVAEMAAYLHTKNLTLNQQLQNIYETYGYHISKTSYVICNDPPTVKRIFTRLRNFEGENVYPKSCGGYNIVNVRDVTTGYDSSQPDQKCVLPVTKSSQMVTFTLQNGIVATLRTSGTEPKIKFYTEFCVPPGKSDITNLEDELKKVTSVLVEEFLEPDKNNLIQRRV